MLSKVKNQFPAITVLIISSLLFLTRLGSNSLADWDEAWYADASRFMFRSDHFLTPIWNNQYFFDKPPLQYWLTQPFLYLFGETELAYRLPSALAAIALTLITYLWGKQQRENFALKKPSKLANLRVRLLPSEATPSASEGLARALARVTANEQISANEMASAGWLSGFAAAILLSFPHFLDRGRSGNFDALFVFFTTFSMFLMVKNRPALGGIFLGLSWLTKGVFSGLFPVIALLIFKGLALRSKAGPYQTIKTLLVYIFFAVLIYAPWHLLEYTRFDHLIQQSYFAAFDQGEFGGWSWTDIVWRFDLRYLVFLWTFLRWWFPILLITLVWKFHQLIRTPHPRLTTHNSQPTTFYTNQLPFITFIIIFLALSAAKSKNDWYIMPAYPFIALMIADLFNQITSFAPKWLSRLTGLLINAPQPADPKISFSRQPRKSQVKHYWQTVLGAMTRLARIPSRACRENDIEGQPGKQPIVAGAKLVMTLVIISISVSNLYLYRRQAFPFDKWLPEKELGLTVKNLTGPSDLIVTAEYEFPSLRYYSERQVRTAARQPDYEGKYWWIWDNADIATALRRGQNIVAVHRPGSEWPIGVYGYHREKLGESNHRIISRILPNTP